MDKGQLVQEIKKVASGIPDLESLTIVGSHGDPTKELEKTNDFDLLILLKRLDVPSYLLVKDKIDSLAQRVSSSKLKVWSEYRIGPIKANYDTGEEKGVMLHVLLYDLNSFAEYQKVSPFLALDWLKFKALFGKNLTDIYDFQFPTKDDILHAPRASFDYYEKMLSEKVYVFLDIIIEGNNLKYNRNTCPYPRNQWGELFADVLKKVILNTVIVYTKLNQPWADSDLIEEFCEIMPSLAEEKDDIAEIIMLKKRVRNGEDLSAKIESYEHKLNRILAKIKMEVQTATTVSVQR